MAEFTAWPKTKRLFRDIVISEKIDGTNAAIHVEALPWAPHSRTSLDADSGEVLIDDTYYRVTAQSRNRLISPESDNAGFAKWVRANAAELAERLGAGVHFGEWWGVGIQRGYGLQSRRFSLFNTDKWKGLADAQLVIGDVPVNSVPVMYHGPFAEAQIKSALADLAQHGSWAAGGFMDPEGVCVFHSQTRSVFKVTLDNQDCGKWEAPEWRF